MVYINLKFLSIYFFLQSVHGQEPQQDCNVPARGAVQTVSNGQAVPDRYYPWHVAIFKKGGLGRYICGGSIINNQFILTVAHCLYEEKKVIIEDRLFIRAGSNRREGGDYYGVHKTIIHKDYNTFNFQADIALIQTSTVILFSRLVKPVCYTETDFLYVNKDAWIPGWGLTENQTDGITEYLNHAKMPGRTGDTCEEQNPDFYNAYANNYNFCAGHADGTSICTGDSGGGLVMKHNNGWYIRGIASLVVKKQFSSVSACDLSQFALFTDVASFADWIDDNSSSIKPINGIRKSKKRKSGKRKSERECDQYIKDRKSVSEVESPIEFPSNCFLRSSDNRLCGCLLISNRWVITASACIKSNNPTDVIFGVSKLRGYYDTSKLNAIETTITHPLTDLTKMTNHIGLVKLAKDVEFTDEIYPACLHMDKNGPAGGTELMFAMLKASYSFGMQSVRLVQDNKKVVSNCVFQTSPSQICTSGSSTDNCAGDIGAPLQLLINEEKRIFSVVALGGSTGCGNLTMVSARVSHYLDWIEEHVWPD